MGSLPSRLLTVAMSFVLFVTLRPPAQACSLSLATVRVSSDFRVIVRHDSTPIAGIQVEVYDAGERHRGDDETERKPVLTLVTSRDGVAEINNLGKGKYLVETKGPGRGSAVYAEVGDRPDKANNEISLEWPFSLNGTLKTRSLSGELVSNDPWKPFQNVQVQLWAPGLDKPLAKEDTGPQGRFHFNVIRPGVYVLRILGRQDNVMPDDQIEGDVSVELIPSAPDALASVSLRFGMTTCGIEYSSCPVANATPMATASRRIQVGYGPGIGSENPMIKGAEYKLLDDQGALLAEGTTDRRGIGALPAQWVGRARLIVASPMLQTVQQSLDLLTAEDRAPDIVVKMTSLTANSECSAVRLETHASQK